ncbi:fimbria/pilus chaperone family protein [Pseudomonas khavaziana]|uniref:fimbria/pilus chaperone family protein n=1 Tax=Pseudomonas khavaziana TaxID=2842351 RepID=UPI001C3C8520|nr:fimbria/pilus chaperone family protein [Pseudomonas khavaziana]MBV4479501.1 fimbria/pilus periplasmic chaperone [Pseudomonas khavaziana]
MRGVLSAIVAVLGWVSLSYLLRSEVMAAGMEPETSVVILYEADGEATINVRNSDTGVALLHSVIKNVPEDPEPLLIVTPPIARVEPGEVQLVRLISTSKAPLKTQRLKRITFEGIPQSRADGRSSIGITIRQDLPLIVHPRGLPKHHEPWTLLEWKLRGNRLTVHNNSAYVIRMGLEVQLLPSKQSGVLPRTYILPGETLSTVVDAVLAGVNAVEMQPATVYGYSAPVYTAPVVVDGA